MNVPTTPAETRRGTVSILEHQIKRLQRLRDYLVVLPDDSPQLAALGESDYRVNSLQTEIYEREKDLPDRVRFDNGRLARDSHLSNYYSLQIGDAFNGQCGDSEDPAEFVDWFARQALRVVEEVRQIEARCLKHGT